MLPVFIHHELNQKPQTGGAPKQAYVKTCVSQAEKYNEEVILFGDEGMRLYSKNWVDVSDLTSEKWEEFLAVFENFSTYPDAWAKGIFKRFFVFEEYMKEKRIDRCVILDSDVLVWCNFEKLDCLKGVDVALEIEENQRMMTLPFENEYRWNACAGVAVMTLTALCDFTAFVIDTYKQNKSLLLEKWNIHKKYHQAGGVSEMSLLYLWQKARLQQYKILNLGIAQGDILPCITVNGCGKSSENNKNYEVMQSIGLKECIKVKFIEGIPYVREMQKSMLVKVLALHFVGKSKIFMGNFNRGKTYGGGSKCDWYYWVVRNRLSKIKKMIKKG